MEEKELNVNIDYLVEKGLVNYTDGVGLREGGKLADIAPTLLEMMGLPKPAEMTGESLLVSK